MIYKITIKITIILLLVNPVQLAEAQQLVLPDQFNSNLSLNLKQSSNDKKIRSQNHFISGKIGEFLASNWWWVTAGAIATASLASSGGGGGSSSQAVSNEPERPIRGRVASYYETKEYNNSLFLRQSNAAVRHMLLYIIIT